MKKQYTAPLTEVHFLMPDCPVAASDSWGDDMNEGEAGANDFTWDELDSHLSSQEGNSPLWDQLR